MTGLVAGIDLSTQSTKIVVCDSATGAVRREASAPHPDATEVDPAVWWTAFGQASAGGMLDDVDAIAVAGQQHGMILLDADRKILRHALLWNDTRSAGAATELVAELGPQVWAQAVGSVPVAAFTVSKLRWVATHEPAVAACTESVVLPHDWLTSQLLTDHRLFTDRGDASGTGYWSPASGDYQPDLISRAFGRALATPHVLGPTGIAGETAHGAVVTAGTGDNMAAALGLDTTPGDLVVSIGTSGTVFAVTEHPTADSSGAVAGFCDATGNYLPLVCTLNAARVLVAAAAILGTDLAGLDQLAIHAQPGANGLVLLPYLDGERTPNLPTATGTLRGLTRASMTPENVARAAVEGLLCGLADAVDALNRQGVVSRRAILIGGGARSKAVQAVAPSILGMPVVVPDPREYVALGAARQAAWALTGQRPRWAVQSTPPIDPSFDGGPLRAQFSAARDQG